MMENKKDLQKVYAVQDQDSHWYVIPFDLKDEFFSDEENGANDEYEAFIEKYSQYMTGGGLNLIQLYADKLTPLKADQINNNPQYYAGYNDAIDDCIKKLNKN